MAQPTMEAVIEREYETVSKEREDLLARRAEIDDKLRALDRRLKPQRTTRPRWKGSLAPTQARANPAHPPPAALHAAQAGRCRRRSSPSSRIFPQGATAEVINSELQATPLKRRSPIAAALFRMKKNNVLHQPKPRGPYFIPTPTREVFERP